MLKNYTLNEKIGEGGYGVVYKAKQISTGQDVAIKILKFKESNSQQSQSQQIARFDRETQLCAEINHPNIVKLLDKGYTENNAPFAVFEYLSGDTLKDHIGRNNMLTAEVTATIMEQVLDALICAHEKGIIHRDLKPHNIMVTETGTKLHVKILDFGMGAFIDDFRATDLKGITLTQEVIGTPAYSSPEQLRGEPPTVKSDLYAWGLIFLECLTGRPVIQGISVAEIFQKQLNPEEVPLPPSIIGHPIAKLLNGVLQKNLTRRISNAMLVFEQYQTINFSTIVGDITPQNSELPVDENMTEVNQFAWRSAHSEKRLVTVLCAKLSLIISEESNLDTETLETIQKDQLFLCKDTGVRFGGYISGIMADTIIMYFGYPQTSDTDARRAGRTALELVSDVQKRSALLYAKHRIRIDVRIALNSGTVHIKHKTVPDGLVTNTAFNMLFDAKPGTIITGATTQKLLDPYLEFQSTNSQGVFSGGNDTSPVYILTGERPTEALSNLSPRSASQQMIGRETEQKQIFEAWNAISQKNGAAVLIKGQAGIGKSKLTYETKKQLSADGYVVRECYCLPEYQNNALYPIFEILKKEIGIQDIETSIPKLEAALKKIGCDIQKVIPILCSWFSIPFGAEYDTSPESPAAQKEILFDTLKKSILAIDSNKKFMLIIEDLHWIDPTSLEFLTAFIDTIDHEKCFLLLTARPEFQQDWNAENTKLIELSTLSEIYAENFIKTLINQKEITKNALAYISNRADGIPLFIEDLTYMLLEQKDLVFENDTYTLTAKFDQNSVPITLKGLLNARLDRLGLAKETAQLASAIGREFSYELLIKSSVYDEGMVQANLNSLLEANLIYHHRKVKNDMYVFRHALIRDASYDSMVSQLRKAVHGRIATTIERLFPEVANKNPFELARHLAASEKYEKASKLGLEAIKKNIKNSANSEALISKKTVLDWIQNITNEIQKIENELVLNDLILPAQMAVSGYGAEEVVEINKRNEYLIHKAEADNNLVSSDIIESIAHKIEWGSFLNYHFHSKREKAAEIANSILEKLNKKPNRDIEVGVLPLIANAAHADGKLMEAENFCKRIFEIYNPDTDIEIGINYSMESKCSAHYLLAGVYIYQGKPESAIIEVKKAIEWGEKIEHPVTITLAYLFYTLIAYFLDDKELVKEITTKHSLKHDDKSEGNWVTMHLKMMEAWSNGEIEYAESYVQNILSSKQYYALSWYEPSLAETYINKNQIDRAIDLLEKSLERSLIDNEKWGLSLVRRVLAECYYKKHNELNEKVVSNFIKAIKDAKEINAIWFELNAIVSYGEILHKSNEHMIIKEDLNRVLNKISEGKKTKLYQRAIKLID